ncbi:MAG: hotdog domain-containing protein [Candidatus Acidiferrales bacterium]
MSVERESAPQEKIPLGLEATVEKIIPPEWTLSAFDSRLPPVLSTPAMIGMMEVAAAKAVQPSLPEGAITVGTRIEVDHLKAVPGGTLVFATARLARYQGRFLVFEVEARTESFTLGRGRVFRAIVEPKSFTQRADARKKRSH